MINILKVKVNKQRNKSKIIILIYYTKYIKTKK